MTGIAAVSYHAPVIARESIIAFAFIFYDYEYVHMVPGNREVIDSIQSTGAGLAKSFLVL